MNFKTNFNLFGEKTLIVDFKNKIDNNIDVAWKSELCISIQKEFQDILEDTIFSLSEITLFFKISPTKAQKQNIINFIDSFSLKKQNIIRNIWEIPVCFDRVFSEDLFVKNDGNLIIYESYISEFIKCIFEVHHYGFLPGFFYLSGLPSKLHLPRKANPVKSVAPGTLAVGGAYAGIYPQKSPGGWNRIGKTYYSFFNRKKNPPCYLLPGDKVKFISIDIEEYQGCIKKIDHNIKIPKSSPFEIIY